MIGIQKVKINTPTIRLDQFLKWQGLAATGGQAKELIIAGQVQVNGQVETRRTHELVPGDEVEVKGVRFKVVATPAG
ncbi:RNA-binding S4 domain-containing protein [Moorella sp. Hama-1]|uniref:RNA-binding S4 domain-containing protein n=1 Tax=Moorella sp. Hama-1 TaxID=2138101 RepID=UPI001379E136|nr:RNA-binding S4 domain-containing protein [Moorella sp. Hama-1]BCV19934.1 RNA-binding protein S4 [Moorella sp. Hama-1]